MQPGKMHPDEVEITVATVRGLIAEQFPQWAGLPVTRVPSAGTVNALFRIGEGLVARFPITEWGAADIAREYKWLPRLAPLLPVPVPQPVALGKPGEAYPWEWSVYRWLEGENPAPGAGHEGLARDLAQFVAALRMVDSSGAPLAERGALVPRDAATRRAITDCAGLVDSAAVTAVWDAALRAPEWSGPPTWAHCDLLPGNILVANGRLSAVIDWAAAGIGDPACDLIPAWSLLSRDSRSAFREALAVGEGEWARGRGWALSIALIALPYYLESNPAFAAVARYTIQQVLAGA